MKDSTVEALAIVVEEMAKIAGHEGDPLAALATLRQGVHELGLSLNDDHARAAAITRHNGALIEPYATTAAILRRRQAELSPTTVLRPVARTFTNDEGRPQFECSCGWTVSWDSGYPTPYIVHEHRDTCEQYTGWES